MARRPGGLLVLDGLQMVRKPTESIGVLSSLATYFPRTGVFQLEEFIFPTGSSLTVVDDGGVNGGWVAHQLGTMPSSQYEIVGGILDVNVDSVAAGISATADVEFGVGSAAASVAPLAGTAINMNILNTITLTGGAGSGQTAGPAAPLFLDGKTSTDIYFNISVQDADISADAAVTFDAVIRLFVLDLSRGV